MEARSYFIKSAVLGRLAGSGRTFPGKISCLRDRQEFQAFAIVITSEAISSAHVSGRSSPRRSTVQTVRPNNHR